MPLTKSTKSSEKSTAHLGIFTDFGQPNVDSFLQDYYPHLKADFILGKQR